MAEVQVTLKKLQAQKVKYTTLATTVSQYDTMINRQLSFNLPVHAFWTTNSVIKPIIDASFDYKYLKLRPQAKEWIRNRSNKLGRLA